MSKEYKIDWGPGYRFFMCDECDHEWTSKSRDWTSPSLEPCPISEQDYEKCRYGIGEYQGGEPHYEWPTDQSGNLIEELNNEE